VAIVAVCADLTRGKGHFNALSGLVATALAVGGVVGPLGPGILVEHVGFLVAYDTLALIAMIAALLFIFCMPETRADGPKPEPAKAGFVQAVPRKEVAVE
jgi:MFS family permease